MKHVYRLQKTDSVCDIDQVLCALREVPGVQSATLLEEAPRVVVVSEPPVPLEQLNDALAKHVPCRLEDGQVQPE
jgi:hypothetical protein